MPARKKMKARITMMRSTLGLILGLRFRGGGERKMSGGGTEGEGGCFIVPFFLGLRGKL